MNLAETAEEAVVRESARKMLEGQCPPALVRRLLGAGKHLIVEKPFAANADEALTMYRAARDAGVAGFVNCDLRWFPNQVLLE